MTQPAARTQPVRRCCRVCVGPVLCDPSPLPHHDPDGRRLPGCRPSPAGRSPTACEALGPSALLSAVSPRAPDGATGLSRLVCCSNHTLIGRPRPSASVRWYYIGRLVAAIRYGGCPPVRQADAVGVHGAQAWHRHSCLAVAEPPGPCPSAHQTRRQLPAKTQLSRRPAELCCSSCRRAETCQPGVSVRGSRRSECDTGSRFWSLPPPADRQRMAAA